MKKIKTKSGYIAYEATAEETGRLGGCGICDDCGEFAASGYLVPVLDHYMCPECFHDFEGRGTYYPEDIPVETRTAEYFESRIPLQGDETQ